jgi:hypothetical protein
MRTGFLYQRLDYRNRYNNPTIAALVQAGIFGAGNAWNLDRMTWPLPCRGRPRLRVIEGGAR